jgi:flagellar hook assembly protein FlgD
MEVVLGRRATVEIEVYGIGGRLVKRIVDASLEAGTHRLTWDGRNEQGQMVSSGVYLYRASIDGERMERKVVMLK